MTWFGNFSGAPLSRLLHSFTESPIRVAPSELVALLLVMSAITTGSITR
jgi:hypothetical protein